MRFSLLINELWPTQNSVTAFVFILITIVKLILFLEMVGAWYNYTIFSLLAYLICFLLWRKKSETKTQKCIFYIFLFHDGWIMHNKQCIGDFAAAAVLLGLMNYGPLMFARFSYMLLCNCQIHYIVLSDLIGTTYLPCSSKFKELFWCTLTFCRFYVKYPVQYRPSELSHPTRSILSNQRNNDLSWTSQQLLEAASCCLCFWLLCYFLLFRDKLGQNNQMMSTVLFIVFFLISFSRSHCLHLGITRLYSVVQKYNDNNVELNWSQY